MKRQSKKQSRKDSKMRSSRDGAAALNLFLKSQNLKPSDQELVLTLVNEMCAALTTLSGNIGPAVSVFGSARCKPGDRLYEETLRISERLAKAGLAVITGGGPCVMEAGLKGAFGRVPTVGLNIVLPFEKHSSLVQSHTADFSRFMGLRKWMFVLYSRAYIYMDGGFGTLDELFEVLTLMQTGLIETAPIYLVGAETWSPLVEYLRVVLLGNGRISARDLDLFKIVDVDDPFIEDDLVPALFGVSSENAA